MSDTAQADLAVRCGRQNNVVRLDVRKLFEHGAGVVSETGALLPQFEDFPQHEGEDPMRLWFKVSDDAVAALFGMLILTQ